MFLNTKDNDKNLICIICLIVLVAVSAMMLKTPERVSAATPSLSPKKKTITVGNTLKVTIKNKPSKYKNKTVKWTTSSKKVCAIQKKGKSYVRVKAKSAGTSTITGKYGSMKVKCKITVKNPVVKPVEQPVPAISSVVPMSSKSFLICFQNCTPLENGIIAATGNANTGNYPNDLGVMDFHKVYDANYLVNFSNELCEGDEVLIAANTDQGFVYYAFRYQTGVYNYSDKITINQPVGTEFIYTYNPDESYEGKLIELNNVEVTSLPEGIGSFTVSYTKNGRRWKQVVFAGTPVKPRDYISNITGIDELGNTFTTTVEWHITEAEPEVAE